MFTSMRDDCDPPRIQTHIQYAGQLNQSIRPPVTSESRKSTAPPVTQKENYGDLDAHTSYDAATHLSKALHRTSLGAAKHVSIFKPAAFHRDSAVQRNSEPDDAVPQQSDARPNGSQP